MNSSAIRAVDINNPVARAIYTTLMSNSYENVLPILLEISPVQGEYWKKAAEVNYMVVTTRPESAHEWLNLFITTCCSEQTWTAEELQAGSILGLLRAGVCLDEDAKNTDFQRALLENVAKIICEGKRNVYSSPPISSAIPFLGPSTGLRETLAHTLRNFLFPKKRGIPVVSNMGPAEPELSQLEMGAQRMEQVRRTIEYLHERLKSTGLNHFGRLFIHEFCAELFCTLTPQEMIDAMHRTTHQSDP